MRTRSRALLVAMIAASAAARDVGPDQGTAPTGPRIEVTFTTAARSQPVTGMVYVAIARDNSRTPIDQAGPTGAPLFSRYVEGLAAGSPATISASDRGHPVASLRDLPAGEYWMQAFVNVYTRFARADGKTVWLHMDRGEGQDWKRSPGNLFGDPVKVTFAPSKSEPIRLVAGNVLAPIPAQPDTRFVKRIRVKSEILTKWWGHPIELGATVLLPAGYDDHPAQRYPVNYEHGHFSTDPPGDFGSGGTFDAYWKSPGTPRFISVTLQHPTPYYDDSYGVNSENNGPYGDAIMRELIPAVEERFRVIREPWARILSGGSTGGWIALAQQIFYPDFYGGTFASCPDPVDFRYHQIVDIYKDPNAYFIDHGWMKVDRPNHRGPDGNIRSMMKDENWYELVVGDRSRSGGQWDIWEATYSPVGADGYPKRLWDKATGQIDRAVAESWRKYDLRHILETNWRTLGPKIAHKLHVYSGDMDSYYLNNATELLNDFLTRASNPKFSGEIVFQRRAPHCWGPDDEELMKKMVAHIERYAPPGADLRGWRY
jgi:putative esterase